MGQLVHALITPERLLRTAVLYLRQSSPGQVRDNIGSAAVQRAQMELAKNFGFADVVVVDEDMGRSGSATELRSGFHQVCRLVASGTVGAVFAVNASRLAREVHAFSELIILCRHHDAILVLDGRPRDPTNPQDVAMLHVEGVFAELDNGLRMQGLRDARLAKARLGKRVSRVPTGWIEDPDGTIAFDPEVYDAVKELPILFWKHGSARGTVGAMTRTGRLLPVRRGLRVHWKSPSIDRLLHFLLSPTFAGTYIFGRTESVTNQAKRPNGQHARRRTPKDQWITIPGYYPAYTTLAEQERIRDQLRRNNFQARHRPGRGPALCQGGLTCAKCGGTLSVSDPRPHRFSHYYQCNRESSQHGTAPCISIQGRDLDAAVERAILRALSAPPLTVLTGLLAEARAAEQVHAAQIESERARLLYEERYAADHLDAVDPRNRLVHARFQAKLEQASAARIGFEQRLAAQPPRPPVDGTEEELRALCRLAADIPALWRHPLVTDHDRKEIRACLIERIVVRADAEAVEGTIVWVSGAETPVRVWRREGLRRLIRERHAAGMTVAEIQVWLANGDPETGQRWKRTTGSIYQVLRRFGLRPNPVPRRTAVDRAAVQRLYDGGLTLREIAARLDADGVRTTSGKPWTGNSVYGSLPSGGRRERLERIHREALDAAMLRGLTNRQAAEE